MNCGLTTDAKDISALHAGDKLTAHITLKDGRVLNVETVVDPASPQSHAAQQDDPGRAVAFRDSTGQSRMNCPRMASFRFS